MEQKRTYEEAVEITVKWWSEKAFDTLLNQNNGDKSSTGSFTFLLGNMLSMDAQKSVTPEARKIFEQTLTAELIQHKDSHRNYKILDVDYHPNTPLKKACEAAGINEMCLPIKTFTIIESDNTVAGRYQYGSPFFYL